MICVGRSAGTGVYIVVVVGNSTALNVVVGVGYTATHDIVVVVGYSTAYIIIVVVGHCTTLNIVVVVGDCARINVVVGVDAGTVDRAGAGTSVCASTGIVSGYIAHTVAGAVSVHQAGATVTSCYSSLLIDQCLCRHSRDAEQA